MQRILHLQKSKKEKTPAESEIEDEEVQDMNAAAETTTEAPIKKKVVFD